MYKRQGSDRPFALPEAQLELIRRVLEANRNVIVVLNAGGNLDMSPFLENAAAVLHAWYPGEEGGTAAVSYTHLDVYKRQTLRGASPVPAPSTSTTWR